MNDLAFWTAFLFAAIIINISPGPELIFVLTRTLSHGKKHGFYSSLGTGSGSLVHVGFVAFGLAVILTTSLVVFLIIKILGACYLCYLGIQALISKETRSLRVNGRSQENTTSFDAYRRGVFVGLLNPKSIIFFMAFLPQFVRANDVSFCLQILILGTITVLMGILFEVLAIFMTSKVKEIFFANEIVAHLLDKVMGSILILLGLKLAFSTQNE